MKVKSFIRLNLNARVLSIREINGLYYVENRNSSKVRKRE